MSHIRKSASLAHAFSLIEMLAVMTVLIVLMSLAVPTLRSTLDATRVAQSGNRIAALIERARTHATTTQKVAAIRFYQADGGSRFAAVRVFERMGQATNTLGRLFRLDEPVVVSGLHSPALTIPTQQQVRTATEPTASFTFIRTVQPHSFRARPIPT